MSSLSFEVSVRAFMVIHGIYNTFDFSTYRFKFVILSTCFGEGDLESYEGTLGLHPKDWEALPKLSLREASHQEQPPK